MPIFLAVIGLVLLGHPILAAWVALISAGLWFLGALFTAIAEGVK